MWGGGKCIHTTATANHACVAIDSQGTASATNDNHHAGNFSSLAAQSATRAKVYESLSACMHCNCISGYKESQESAASENVVPRVFNRDSEKTVLVS